jgi:hydroxypyruvate isomerase
MAILKQSVPDWCFLKNQAEAETYYRQLREIGYTGVEMLPADRWPLAKNAGLEIINLAGPGMREGFNRLENHESLIAEFDKLIEAAGANGIPAVIFLSGNSNGQPRHEGLKNCITAAKVLAAKAEAHGVTLLFEMLNNVNHADYQADHSSYGFDLVEAVGSHSVKILYDLYHMHRMGENIVDDVVNHLDKIAHLHVAGSPNRDFPGPDQEIDYATVVDAILSAGYSGYWGQEWLCPDANAVIPQLTEAYQLIAGYGGQRA